MEKAIDDFLDAGTEYVLALIDARTMHDPQRLTPLILQNKALLRQAMIQLFSKKAET